MHLALFIFKANFNLHCTKENVDHVKFYNFVANWIKSYGNQPDCGSPRIFMESESFVKFIATKIQSSGKQGKCVELSSVHAKLKLVSNPACCCDIIKSH